jgi:hypothetical protein
VKNNGKRNLPEKESGAMKIAPLFHVLKRLQKQ